MGAASNERASLDFFQKKNVIVPALQLQTEE